MIRGNIPPGHQTTDAGSEKEKEESGTGLPWPHTWRGVYLVVFASFVTWVTLLAALQRYFR